MGIITGYAVASALNAADYLLAVQGGVVKQVQLQNVVGPINAIDINGGTIDGATIGSAVPAAGIFTTGTFTSIAMASVTAPALLNSWVNYGLGYQTTGYWKDADGVVHLHGAVKSGTVDAAVFTLPSGYYPTGHQEFVTAGSNGAGGWAIGIVEVQSTGSVIIRSPSNNALVSFNGISFRTT